MTICKQHPGGAKELPDAAFYPSDQGRNYAPCKECRKTGKRTPKPQQPATTVTAIAVGGAMRKIGGYYIHENALLIADAVQDGKLVLHTTILEIDGDTKHPRNKRIIFTRQHSPDEYRDCLAWLTSLCGSDASASNDERDAALQLADEATQKLIAAQAEIAELKAALEPLKALLGKAVVRNGSI